MCQAPVIWLNRKESTMRGNGGCGRPLGAGDQRGQACTQDPRSWLFTPKASTEMGVRETPSVPRGSPCKSQEGHRTGRVSRRWGCAVTSPRTNIWVPTQVGEMDSFAFNCLEPGGKADNEQMGGQERLPGAGDVWVGCRQIKKGMGARHSSEKEQEIHPKNWK